MAERTDHRHGTDPGYEQARRILSEASGIVVLTGAGVSTDSGIPDFRGPDGVWTRDPEAEKYSSIDHYLSSSEVRKGAWRRRAENPAWHAEPNAGHLALAELERRGRLELLVTQNIDGLHLRAGNSRERLVEVHGTMLDAVCVACGRRGPMREVLDRLEAGEEDPPCPDCGGILKSATVLFGEALDERDIHRAFDAAAAAEVLLCVGTSLQVFPIARMVPIALSQGAQVVIVNGEPTPYDDDAAVVRGSISEVLPGLLGL
ncbi:MAG TPA: Sir2 family NAD-dependent protein deacetylase [Microthrixaceae bacterium]|nr:Sir2 family NAD-dependent protein deacetylase [Microthrixaceae bacterium]